jgi:hypothetical protein
MKLIQCPLNGVFAEIRHTQLIDKSSTSEFFNSQFSSRWSFYRGLSAGLSALRFGQVAKIGGEAGGMAAWRQESRCATASRERLPHI